MPAGVLGHPDQAGDHAEGDCYARWCAGASDRLGCQDGNMAAPEEPDDQTPATPEQVAALQARLRDLYDQIGASRRRHREWFLTLLRQSLAETSEPSER